MSLRKYSDLEKMIVFCGKVFQGQSKVQKLHCGGAEKTWAFF